MKFIILFVLFCVLIDTITCSHGEKVKLTIKESGISDKKKAEIAGFVSGATAGVAKGILKKKVTTSKQIFVPVKAAEPKYKVKYISVVKPVLVREYPQPDRTQYYVKTETKVVKKPKKSIFPFLKGFVKGKFIGKSVSKTFG
ncbi:uncharacterized protein LOC128391915 [Panonychus citri]|uniref:uncharacterized protein LOC128391915 n=1 Tax=Panonychus citri TaxID=50023 RepID=UPI002306F3E6|nr:uncharacterized protein LOC128391915 [Panonychus citri]